MSATPALSNGLIGRTQERISTMLYLDTKDSQFIHTTLEVFALELLREYDSYREEVRERSNAFQQYHDPGDEA